MNARHYGIDAVKDGTQQPTTADASRLNPQLLAITLSRTRTLLSLRNMCAN
jgi:hypothetical protein